jgi:hypothetical protein
MNFYSIGYFELGNIPIRSFWLLHKNIDRIKAGDDIRTAIIISRSMTGSGLEELFDDLRDQTGKIVIYKSEPSLEETYDKEGLEELKALSKLSML